MVIVVYTHVSDRTNCPCLVSRVAFVGEELHRIAGYREGLLVVASQHVHLARHRRPTPQDLEGFPVS